MDQISHFLLIRRQICNFVKVRDCRSQKNYRINDERKFVKNRKYKYILLSHNKGYAATKMHRTCIYADVLSPSFSNPKCAATKSSWITCCSNILHDKPTKTLQTIETIIQIMVKQCLLSQHSRPFAGELLRNRRLFEHFF